MFNVSTLVFLPAQLGDFVYITAYIVFDALHGCCSGILLVFD
jgi:hypothetical protein